VTLRGARSKSKQAALAAHAHPLADASPFDQWAHSVQAEQDPVRRDLLIEFGQSEGWVGPDGEVLDPDATGADRLNADIRRAWRGG